MMQQPFGGSWTEQKLSALQGYLSQYTLIFNKNSAARFYSTHYVDAFAGTGYMQRPEWARFAVSFYTASAIHS